MATLCAITARPATVADHTFVVDCFLQSMRPGITAWRAGWNEPGERARFEEALDLDRTTIIETDGVAVGFVMLVEMRHALQVHTIAVLPDYQSRGIGTEVMSDLIDLAGGTGRDVLLSVLKASPRAEAFYTKLGFVVVEESRHRRHMRFAARHGRG